MFNQLPLPVGANTIKLFIALWLSGFPYYKLPINKHKIQISDFSLPTPACSLPPPGSLPGWISVDSAFSPLPRSIKIFKSTGTLDGAPNISYYVEANLKDRSLNFTTQVGNSKRYQPSAYYSQNDSPLLVVNGTFFSFADNRNLNLVIRKGDIVAHNPPSVAGRGKDTLDYFYPFRGALGITSKRKADVAWVFTDSAYLVPMAIQTHPVRFRGSEADPDIRAMKSIVSTSNNKLKKWKRIETAIGGGPVLLQEGKIAITNEEEMMFVGKAKLDKHPRTAIGYTGGGKLIILVIQGRLPGTAEGATLEQEARILQELGCYEALNLDGGGSSCMLVNGKETIKPSDKEGQRPVPAVFMISGQ